jgi:hypothetical protein
MRGGLTSNPSQEYLAGIDPFCVNAVLDILIVSMANASA